MGINTNSFFCALGVECTVPLCYWTNNYAPRSPVRTFPGWEVAPVYRGGQEHSGKIVY